MGELKHRDRSSVPEITSRDRSALAFLAEQYGARLDVLGVLLRRLGASQPADVALSNSGVRQQLGRWRRAGWVRTEIVLGSTWVTPTPKGMAVADRRYAPWRVPMTRVVHTHAVNVVRLWYEANPVRVAQYGPWTSERALFVRRGWNGRWHVPDGVLGAADRREVWSVEVELTAKHRPRYANEVLSRLHESVTGLLYFVPAALMQRVDADLSDAVVKTGRSDLSVDVRLLPNVAGVSYLGQKATP